jgi:hypothetical protein
VRLSRNQAVLTTHMPLMVAYIDRRTGVRGNVDPPSGRIVPHSYKAQIEPADPVTS